MKQNGLNKNKPFRVKVKPSKHGNSFPQELWKRLALLAEGYAPNPPILNRKS